MFDWVVCKGVLVASEHYETKGAPHKTIFFVAPFRRGLFASRLKKNAGLFLYFLFF
jgi:hypothetical protein